MPGQRHGVEVADLDLADLKTVREWGQRAQDFGHPLDVLVNNAGVVCEVGGQEVVARQMQNGLQGPLRLTGKRMREGRWWASANDDHGPCTGACASACLSQQRSQQDTGTCTQE